MRRVVLRAFSYLCSKYFYDRLKKQTKLSGQPNIKVYEEFSILKFTPDWVIIAFKIGKEEETEFEAEAFRQREGRIAILEQGGLRTLSILKVRNAPLLDGPGNRYTAIHILRIVDDRLPLIYRQASAEKICTNFFAVRLQMIKRLLDISL